MLTLQDRDKSPKVGLGPRFGRTEVRTDGKSHARFSFPICPVFLTGAENAHVARSLRRSHRQGAPRSEFGPGMLLALGLPLYPARQCYTLNHMVQYNETRLDASFAALSDATRRGVLEQLSRADASITDLAGKFHMTLTGMKKHVAVLERAALVTTEKTGRVRTCRLAMGALEEEAAWIERHRQLWSARFNELDKIVEHLKSKEKADARRKSR
jgi:DNA-binding transcriptional ArsR family regulator